MAQEKVSKRLEGLSTKSLSTKECAALRSKSIMAPEEKLIAARDILIFLATKKNNSADENIEILSLALKAICRQLSVRRESVI